MGTQEFGEYLRTRREAQGLTIADVSERTKIHTRHIRAIEEGRLEALPGIVYAKAFVRHYAKAVGEDPDAMAAQFDQVIQLQGESAIVTRARRRSKRRARARRESRFPWPWVLVILALAALGILIAKAVEFGGGVEAPPRRAPGALSTEPIVETPRLDSPLQVAPGIIPEFGSGADVGPDQSAPLAEPEAPATPEESASEQVEELDETTDAGSGERAIDGEDAAFAEGAPVSVSGLQDQEGIPAGPQAEAALAAAALGVVLEVAVERACWFSVEADGVLIFSGVLDDGESAVWVADEELRVRYGRPEGVFITLNGEFLGRAGTGVITRVYSREGVVEL